MEAKLRQAVALKNDVIDELKDVMAKQNEKQTKGLPKGLPKGFPRSETKEVLCSKKD